MQKGNKRGGATCTAKGITHDGSEGANMGNECKHIGGIGAERRNKYGRGWGCMKRLKGTAEMYLDKYE